MYWILCVLSLYVCVIIRGLNICSKWNEKKITILSINDSQMSKSHKWNILWTRANNLLLLSSNRHKHTHWLVVIVPYEFDLIFDSTGHNNKSIPREWIAFSNLFFFSMNCTIDLYFLCRVSLGVWVIVIVF